VNEDSIESHLQHPHRERLRFQLFDFPIVFSNLVPSVMNCLFG
jgi:hypothetical protein